MIIHEEINNNIKLKGYAVATDSKFEVEKPLPTHNGWSMLLIGTPGSGKTSLYLSIVKQYKRQFGYIFYFNSSINTIDEKFLSKLAPERTYTDLSPLPEILDKCKRGVEYDYTDKKLFIIDDLVYQLKDYEEHLQQLMMNRRHFSASIILITQKCSQVPLSIRTQFDNIIYFSGNTKTENERLFQDYISLNKNDFQEIINYVFDGEKHVFLYIDKRNNKFYKKFNLLTFQ